VRVDRDFFNQADQRISTNHRLFEYDIIHWFTCVKGLFIHMLKENCDEKKFVFILAMKCALTMSNSGNACSEI
jgi:hypothetical protein